MITPRFVIVALLCLAPGCMLPGGGPRLTSSAPATPSLFVATPNEELVWERSVDVLHDFQFEIARENRLGRTIETFPKVGSGLLEPWHHDSIGFENRLESTLQSIRRIVTLSLQPSENGQGYVVSVAVYKEIEDLDGIAANSAGAATFSESTPLERDLDPVVGQSSPSRWVPLGRDPALEQAILERLRQVFSM